MMAEKGTRTPQGRITQRQQDAPPREGRSQRPSYAYERFNPRKQLGRVLLVSVCRWLLTAALGISIYVVLWHYSSNKALSIQTKREFNALIVGLSICLGLNIASSLKAMAGEVRWWILSLRKWPIREADLIMQAEKLTHVAHLGWVSSSYWIRLYAVVWLVINVASQVALATLGLTYSTNPSKWTTITQPGNVSIPDMSSLETGRVVSSKSQTLGALRYTANSYGTIALGWIWGTLEDIPQAGALWDNDDPLIFCGVSTCRYVFQESTPENKKYELTVSTNRSVGITGSCNSWRVLSGGNGLAPNITIDDRNRTEIGLPVINGADQSTFMVDVSTEQGDTWSIVSALEASETDPWYYRCNVSIGSVENSVSKEHELGVDVTSLACAAIALQGYGALNLEHLNDTYQYQSYPAESAYGSPQNGSSEGMGTLLAAFATGVVAVIGQANSDITVPGLQPQKSVTLDISRWKYVHIILGLTLGLQLLLALLVALLANKVLMRDDSHLSTAALLSPTVQKVGDRGLVANGKEIASMFCPGATLTYRSSSEGVYYISSDP